MSDLQELYQSIILDHNRRPKNYGTLEGASHRAAGRNPDCGDEVTVELLLSGDRIDDVRFKRVVRPGDVLTLECQVETVRGPIGRGKARATVGGELAVRGTLTFAVEQ